MHPPRKICSPPPPRQIKTDPPLHEIVRFHYSNDTNRTSTFPVRPFLTKIPWFRVLLTATPTPRTLVRVFNKYSRHLETLLIPKCFLRYYRYPLKMQRIIHCTINVRLALLMFADKWRSHPHNLLSSTV